MALFFWRQRGRRLVKDDDFGVVMHGTGNFNHLAFGCTQTFHHRGRIDREVQRLQKLLGGNVGAAQPVQKRFRPQIQVLRHRHGWHQRCFLKHHGDARLQRLMRVLEAGLNTPVGHSPAAGGNHTRDHLGQCRFSRAIFTQKRVNLAPTQIKVYIAHSRDRTVGFGDIFQPDDGFHHITPSSDSRQSPPLQAT